MLRLVRAVVLLSAALFIGVRANADPLTYSFITSNTPFGIISTSLPAMPTPSSFTATSFEITAPLIVDGDPMTLPVDFFTLAAGGGAGGGGTHVDGPVLFTGPTSSPTFLTGTFAFGDFTLTISPATSPIPEPPTLFLLGAGAVASGLILRRFRFFHRRA